MLYEYGIETFPRETINWIADRFRDYFDRKRCDNLSLREARMMIDYVAGPAPPPSTSAAMDYSRVKVTGGGTYPRPSKQDIEEIYNKRFPEDEPLNEWDEVFDELIESNKKHSGTVKIINMAFRDRQSHHIICDELHIGRTTYFRHRRTILEKAGLIAVKKGLLRH